MASQNMFIHQMLLRPTQEELESYSPDFTIIAVPGLHCIPEIDGVPCTGRDSGACIGLAEDAPQYVPPTSSVGSDPTITGSTN